MKRLFYIVVLLTLTVCNVVEADTIELTKPFQTPINLPIDLPESFSVVVPFSGQQLTLKLEKNEVFGENTRFLVDDGTGALTEIDPGVDRSYLGTVGEHPEFVVSAVLTKEGLLANINRPGQESITVEPLQDATDTQLHRISVGQTGDYDDRQVETMTDIGDSLLCTDTHEVAASTAAITTIPFVLADTAKTKTSTATLRPTRVMDVLEFEIGVEIGSRAFISSTYESSLEKAKASAQSLVGNLDKRYLRGAGIKHRLGTVMIRTKKETDPMRNSVTSTGGKGRKSLAAFKNYWNSHPQEVGKTHDLAVYHVRYAPSGMAYTNSVGTGNRYATCGGRGATSWANGTVVHEFGHSWALKHNNSSGMFYESKPRNFAGSHAAGGKDVHVSVMHGGGSHNIGRLATDEANRVYQTRQNKRKYGDLVKNPGPIPPFGHRDEAFVLKGKPITIDVIANDYDCNNDVLDVQLLDTVSQKGGTVTLSSGTGPGGRNEVTYTPPADYVGKDFFHYTVTDTTGRKDWGAVYVVNEGPTTVDTTLTSYNYDFGPLGSPVESGWSTISPRTTGDISWSGDKISAADRGSKKGVNNINRDLVYGSGVTMLNHKIANGVWAITINMGDSANIHDQMYVRAEGVLLDSSVNSPAGKFPYVQGQVTVTDGQLNIKFLDKGGRDKNWVLTRLSLKRVGDGPTTVDTSI